MAGPYPPRTALLGGQPTPLPDIPISSIFIILFLLALILHFNFFLSHLSSPPPPPSDKPLPPILVSIFCILRIAALSLRIAWSVHPGNLSLGIASTIFTSAGVALLLILNTILARRVVRDYSPRGASTSTSTSNFHANPNFNSANANLNAGSNFNSNAKRQGNTALRVARVLIFCIIASLAMITSATTDSYFSLSEPNLQSAREVILFSLVFLTLLSILPGLVVTVEWLVSDDKEIKAFQRRVGMVVVMSVLLTVEVGFRCGVAFDKRPVGNPGWKNSKACYYCFVFVIELAVVYGLLVGRWLYGRY